MKYRQFFYTGHLGKPHAFLSGRVSPTLIGGKFIVRISAVINNKISVFDKPQNIFIGLAWGGVLCPLRSTQTVAELNAAPSRTIGMV